MKHLRKFNEDVYYEPEYRNKNDKEIEDEIQPIIENWIDEQVGLEIGFASVMNGGVEIHCGVDRRVIEKERGSTPISGSDKEMRNREESAKEEWRDSAPELIDILEREGYGEYNLGSVTQWDLTLLRDDEASGGPISIKVRMR